jgi:hypothetical protein
MLRGAFAAIFCNHQSQQQQIFPSSIAGNAGRYLL